MTTHTNLIARLREFGPCIAQDVQDALEALEQQVAALQQGGDAKAVQRMQDLENLVAALTAERDAEFEYRKKVERERLHHSSEREALARQLAAMTEERDEDALLQPRITMSNLEMASALAAAQAREAKLRDAAKAVLEVGMGSDFEALNAAFAIPTDDSALMERLKEERERCAEFCEAYDKYDYAVTGRKTLADAIRGLA